MMMLRKLYWTEQSSDAYRTELELKTTKTSRSREHSAAASSTRSDRRRWNHMSAQFPLVVPNLAAQPTQSPSSPRRHLKPEVAE